MERGLYWRIARFRIRRSLLRSGIVMAAAGTDPPWPPLFKGGKLGATFPPGNLRSPQCIFSTARPETAPNYERFRSLNPCGTRVRDKSTKRNRGRGTKPVGGDGPIENLEAGNGKAARRAARRASVAMNFPCLWAKRVVLGRLGRRNRFPSGRDGGSDVKWRGRSLKPARGDAERARCFCFGGEDARQRLADVAELCRVSSEAHAAGAVTCLGDSPGLPDLGRPDEHQRRPGERRRRSLRRPGPVPARSAVWRHPRGALRLACPSSLRAVRSYINSFVSSAR